MFNRFTESARRVILAAKESAKELRSQHIDTEHVLIGLLRTDRRLVRGVLSKAGIDGMSLEKTATASLSAKALKGSLPAELRFSQDAKKAIESSAEEARRLGHNWIGTGHILLGLIGQSAALTMALQYARISLEQLKKQIAMREEDAMGAVTGDKTTRKPSSKQLQITLALPEYCNAEVVTDLLVDLFKALNDLHIASGGSGLKVEEGGSFLGTGAEQVVGR